MNLTSLQISFGSGYIWKDQSAFQLVTITQLKKLEKLHLTNLPRIRTPHLSPFPPISALTNLKYIYIYLFI